jgi:hypothetical protein
MSLRQRIVISLLLAASVVGIVLAFQMHTETEEPVRVGTVRRVYPPAGGSMLRQDTVYADLSFPYTGTLVVDDIEIVEPQLKRFQVGDATRIAYTPGPDSLTGALALGRTHHAVVRYWLPERPDEISGYSWNFTVR